jgi:hypothetical protein
MHHTNDSKHAHCGRPMLPQIFGGSPGAGFGPGGSGSFGKWGKNTVSRSFLALPFPFSFAANGFQHSAQMSYSLLSISFGSHCFAWLHRSHRIIGHLHSVAWYQADGSHEPLFGLQQHQVPTLPTAVPSRRALLFVALRDSPQEQFAAKREFLHRITDVHFFIRLPVAHAEGVRNNSLKQPGQVATKGGWWAGTRPDAPGATCRCKVAAILEAHFRPSTTWRGEYCRKPSKRGTRTERWRRFLTTTSASWLRSKMRALKPNLNESVKAKMESILRLCWALWQEHDDQKRFSKG